MPFSLGVIMRDSLIIIQLLIITAKRIVPPLCSTRYLQGHILLEETDVSHIVQEKRKMSVKDGSILTLLPSLVFSCCEQWG